MQQERPRRIVTSGSSATADQMGLRVVSAGTGTSVAGTFEQKQGRTLQSHALVYLVAGGGAFVTAESEQVGVRAGDILFLIPGIEHRYGPTAGQEWREYWIIYEGSLADRLVKRQVINPSRPFRRPGVRADWVSRWERAFAEAGTGGLIDEAALAGDLFTILAQALAGPGGPLPRANADLVEAIQSFLATQICSAEIDWEAMAANFGVSYSHARALFKQHAGMAPNQYLTSLKLQRAKRLLLSSGDKVRQIAEDLGYGDPYYFSRLFKKHEGVSPKRFREQYQEWIAGD